MAGTIIVSNAAQLLSVLKTATGGENIVLQPGDYGKILLTQGYNIFSNFKTPVTITSADASHPAVITSLSLTGMKNVVLDHIKFDYTATPGAALTATPFTLKQSTNITITNSEFNGDKASGLGAAADGFGTGFGLSVVGGANVVLSNNNIHDFNRGVVVSKTTGVTISGNDLHNMSSDGMDFAQVTNVTIDSNHIHDFTRSPLCTSHPDMIQFWTKGTSVPSSNIKIINNFLDIGAGDQTQSIFMRNEMVDSYGAGVSMFYKNVNISNNVIRNADSHGISVGETNGLTIDNNTLLQSVTTEKGGTISVPYISVANASTTVTITDNVVPSLGSLATGGHAGWTVGNNLLASIDDPNSANYIGKLYYDALDKTNATITDFHSVRGSLVDTMHVGSQLTAALTATTYAGYIDTHPTSGSNNTALAQTFDASHIFNSLGQVAMTGAKVAWDFGDGTKGTGLITNHVYGAQGDYTATATVTLSSGKIVVIDKTLHVQSSSFLDVDFNTNAFDHSTIVNAVTMNTAKLVATASGGHAIDLNGGTVKYDTNADFFNNKEFSLIVDFKKDAGEENQGGRLVYFGGSYVISVGADGLTATVTTTAGSKTLKADNLGIADTDWHRLGLSFSGETGQVKLFLDGHEVASATGLVGGIQKGASGADLYLGGPFGGSFGGQIDNLHISDAAISTTAFTSGKLATASVEFANLTQFDPVATFVASASASPLAAMQPAHEVIDTSPMISLPHSNHYDFSLL
jgi:Right handed beta helix region/PKD domain/Concanavalin A-like lectin/glucanases superfamily